MPAEPLHIFDPRRNFQLQGFTGRAATTTLHDASETGVSISGIFQAAEDFAVLGLYNAYDYFNHLRLKHLPRTDLSSLTLAFDIEYDHTLDGAMRLDAAKYPSVSWDAMTFICGAGTPEDTYEVRLLDYATAIGGGDSPARCGMEISGQEIIDGGIDWLHLFFRDTRYTVTSTDCRFETRAIGYVGPGIPDVERHLNARIYVEDASGFALGDTITIERGGTNAETTRIGGLDTTPGMSFIEVWITILHPDNCYITRNTRADHVAQKLAEIINASGESVAGRFGPDQSGVIIASAGGGSSYQSGTLNLEFKSSTADGSPTGNSATWIASS